ncbi:MAG: 50S ribosomal protein L3 [bacterium]
MIIGKKIKMTQIFDEAGKVIPVTLLECDPSNLKVGQKVKISGISKGKGFQGVVKRWGFRGAPATHGTKHNLRAPGSIGSTNVARVFKGKKMGGHMGVKKTTLRDVEIIEIKKNQIALKGAIPGPNKSEIKIYES